MHKANYELSELRRVLYTCVQVQVHKANYGKPARSRCVPRSLARHLPVALRGQRSDQKCGLVGCVAWADAERRVDTLACEPYLKYRTRQELHTTDDAPAGRPTTHDNGDGNTRRWQHEPAAPRPLKARQPGRDTQEPSLLTTPPTPLPEPPVSSFPSGRGPLVASADALGGGGRGPRGGAVGHVEARRRR